MEVLEILCCPPGKPMLLIRNIKKVPGTLQWPSEASGKDWSRKDIPLGRRRGNNGEKEEKRGGEERNYDFSHHKEVMGPTYSPGVF